MANIKSCKAWQAHLFFNQALHEARQCHPDRNLAAFNSDQLENHLGRKFGSFLYLIFLLLKLQSFKLVMFFRSYWDQHLQLGLIFQFCLNLISIPGFFPRQNHFYFQIHHFSAAAKRVLLATYFDAWFKTMIVLQCLPLVVYSSFGAPKPSLAHCTGALFPFR